VGFLLKVLLVLVLVFRVVPAIVRLFTGGAARPRPAPPAPRPAGKRDTLGGSKIDEGEFEDLPGERR
jgi:hypothetical protein